MTIRRFELLLVGVIGCIGANAQSGFDAINLFEIGIFNPDSIASRHNLHSIAIYYYDDSVKSKKMDSYKEFRNAYPIKYKMYFLAKPDIASCEVISPFKNEKDVVYQFKKTTYTDDSLYISRLCSSSLLYAPDSVRFISTTEYSKAKSLTLKTTYLVDDSMFIMRNFINDIEVTPTYSYYNYRALYWKKNYPEKAEISKKSRSRNDTIVKVDTVKEDSIKGITRYYYTIHKDPVVEEHVEYRGAHVWNKSRLVRTYDRRNRIINYTESFSRTFGDTLSLMLYNTIRWKFRRDGGYTVYEGHPRLDGKPEFITRYNKNGVILNWIRNYSEGGISENKYSYNPSGLLLACHYFYDNKYTGKTVYEYTFSK